MPPLPQHPLPERIERPGGLDPALLRIIQAMARADARRDYDAAQASVVQAASAQDLRPGGA
jgi:hypothetical protein